MTTMPDRPMPGPESGTSIDPAAASVAAVLRAAQHVLLLTHENPDGDGLGSMLALRLGLAALGKTVTCALLDACPERYRFLPGSEALAVAIPEGAQVDCAVSLDCDGEGRLGRYLEAYRAAASTVNVDHHQAECIIGQVNWCDGGAAATGMLVLEVLRALEVQLTPAMATCLYTALAADTGLFRFQNTSAAVLRAAAELVEAGAAPADLAQRVCDRIPLAKARLLGQALAGASLDGPEGEGATLVAALGEEDFAQAGAAPEHTDGVIDDLKRVQGADVILMLREQAGQWRVSLRSQELDVAAIARSLGGGGHRLAAGCELTGTRDEVTQEMLARIRAAREAGA